MHALQRKMFNISLYFSCCRAGKRSENLSAPLTNLKNHPESDC